MNTKVFEHHLQLFSQLSPQTAVLLPYAPIDHLQLTANQRNLKTKIKGKEVLFYPKDPEEEAQQWFKKLSLKGKEILYVYGLGLGYDYEAAKAWLKKKKSRRLVFLEDDLGIIHRFLETKRAAQILQDPQVVVHYVSNLMNDQALERLSWQFIQMPIVFSSLRFYSLYRSEMEQAICHKLVYESSVKNDQIDEYLKFGVAFFRNFYPNLLQLPKAFWGHVLFGKFVNIPAIICGAGPSLNKNLEVLKKLQNKALIFAGGSALNALLTHGIIPHFGAGIDPNPLQLERFQLQKKHKIPIFYRNRLHEKALKAIKGPKLYINGAGGYDIAEWFEKELGIAGEPGETLDEGHNVVNFCCEIAYALGCRRIIFVGMDLAFTDNQQYAKGVVKQTKKGKPEEIVKNPDVIAYRDGEGNPLYTQWRWIAESEWISKFAEAHPKATFVNATEGGMGFKGIPNLTLEEVGKRYLKTRYSFTQKIEKEIQRAAMPGVTPKKVKEAKAKLKQSLKQCLGHLDVLMEENLLAQKSLKKTKQSPQVSGKAALAEIELEEEAGYSAVLKIFNVIHQHIYHPQKEIQQDLWKAQMKLLELQYKRYLFLKRTTQANLLLMD